MVTTTDEVGISDGAFRTIAGYSALAGLCPLIPIPFIDDMIIVRIHRRLCQVLCNDHDFYLSNDNAKLLTSRPSNFLRGAFISAVMWPVKKLLRKLVYVLSIKACADVATTVFHEGWLLARAIEQEYVPKEALARGDVATMRVLRDAIVEARDHVDPSPTTQVMNSAFGLSRTLFGPILDAVKDVAKKTDPGEERIDAAEEQVGPIADRIQDEILKHWSHSAALDAALRVGIENAKQQPGRQLG